MKTVSSILSLNMRQTEEGSRHGMQQKYSWIYSDFLVTFATNINTFTNKQLQNQQSQNVGAYVDWCLVRPLLPRASQHTAENQISL